MSTLTKVGAGWSRTSKTNGEKFISLDIDGRKLLLFKNKSKEKDTHPDYVVMAADETADKPVMEDTATPPDYDEKVIKPEDIPF